MFLAAACALIVDGRSLGACHGPSGYVWEREPWLLYASVWTPRTPPGSFDWAPGAQLPGRARRRQPDGRGPRQRRAPADAVAPRRGAGVAAGRAAVRAHRPRRRAHGAGARHRRRGAADAGRRRAAVARAGARPRGRQRHGAHHHQPGGGQLPAAAGAGAAAAGRARHPGRAGGQQCAGQPAAPRGRHRRAHGAAGPGLAGGAQAGDVPIVACAHESYLRRHGLPRRPDDLLRHVLVGYDRDDTIRRGMAAMGFTCRPSLRAAHRRPAGLRPPGGRRCRHRLRRGLQPAPLAGRGAAAADAEDPAAAVLAGGAPRDPRQPAGAPRLRLPGRGRAAWAYARRLPSQQER
jgi:hypothetical protein